MKKIFLVLLCASVSLSIQAQTSDAEAHAMANLLGVQKKEAMAHLVSVTAKDSVAFWKLYDEYLQKNIQNAKTRIQLYEKTAHSYGDMTATVADSLSKEFFLNRSIQEKSLEEYYGKIKTATNAVLAFQFYQAEVYLITQIRAAIMQQIPTYGEFMNAVIKMQKKQ
jgi:hypothetical protein